MTPKEADGDGIMARTKLLVFGVLASLAANAAAVPPHAHYSDTVRSADGKPVPGAKVLVCSAGTDEIGRAHV